MKNCKPTYLLLCLALLCAVSACTTVELCPEAEHPHVASILVDFDWHGYDTETDKDGNPVKLPSMNIVASRLLNTWRVHGIANPDTKEVINGISAPIITDQDGEESTNEEEGANEEEKGTHPFRLKGGEYKAFAINADERLAIDSLRCYLNNPAATVDTLFLHMEETPRDEISELQGLKLPDFNPTYRYIKNVGRIFYGMNPDIKIHTGQTETLFFDMQPVSQEVVVKFSIQKTGEHRSHITIDKVVAEISGLCGRINVSQAYLDTTNLYRMVFPGDAGLEEVVDGDITHYTTRFYTLGIVPSARKELLVGRGILQLAVQASVPKSLKAQTTDGQTGGADDEAPQEETEEEEETNSLFFYAAANPRQALIDAQLIEKREDKKSYLRYRKEPVVIELGSMLQINSEDIINATDDDTWHENEGEGGNSDVDIEM